MNRIKNDQFQNLQNAVILINKEPGKTSFDTIREFKRMTGIKKIGHSGTLDKFASGLLILCTGQATKLTNYFLNEDKRYICNIQLGVSTDTLDPEGEIIEEKSLESITEHDIHKTIEAFKGEQLQVPPLYSALKIGGERVSDRIRKGESVTLDARKIIIHDIVFKNYNENNGQLVLDIVCSKGTYIRSLARDIGKALKVGAFVKALRRMKSGKFSIFDAVSLLRIKEKYFDKENFIYSMKAALEDYSKIYVNNAAVERILNGAQFFKENIVKVEKNSKKMYIILNEKENLIAIADVDFDHWNIKYRNVFNQ